MVFPAIVESNHIIIIINIIIIIIIILMTKYSINNHARVREV